MPRRRRNVIALLAACVLLFAQLAVAAHACGVSEPAPVMASMAAADEPCEHGSSGNANLCASHCDYGHASFETGKVQPGNAPAMATGLRMPLLQSLLPRVLPRRFAAAAAPPLPLPGRSTVLRI